MDIHLANFHTDHINDGAGNLALNGMANVAYIYVTIQNYVQVNIDHVIFDVDFHPFARAWLEQVVDVRGRNRQSIPAGSAQRC